LLQTADQKTPRANQTDDRVFLTKVVTELRQNTDGNQQTIAHGRGTQARPRADALRGHARAKSIRGAPGDLSLVGRPTEQQPSESASQGLRGERSQAICFFFLICSDILDRICLHQLAIEAWETVGGPGRSELAAWRWAGPGESAPGQATLGNEADRAALDRALSPGGRHPPPLGERGGSSTFPWLDSIRGKATARDGKSATARGRVPLLFFFVLVFAAIGSET
jgi:hypothetical protein